MPQLLARDSQHNQRVWKRSRSVNRWALQPFSGKWSSALAWDLGAKWHCLPSSHYSHSLGKKLCHLCRWWSPVQLFLHPKTFAELSITQRWYEMGSQGALKTPKATFKLNTSFQLNMKMAKKKKPPRNWNRNLLNVIKVVMTLAQTEAHRLSCTDESAGEWTRLEAVLMRQLTADPHPSQRKSLV